MSAAGVNRRWYALVSSDLIWKPRLQPGNNWEALQEVASSASLYRTLSRLCSFNLLSNPHFSSSAMNSRSVGLLMKGKTWLCLPAGRGAASDLCTQGEAAACYSLPSARAAGVIRSPHFELHLGKTLGGG